MSTVAVMYHTICYLDEIKLFFYRLMIQALENDRPPYIQYTLQDTPPVTRTVISSYHMEGWGGGGGGEVGYVGIRLASKSVLNKRTLLLCKYRLSRTHAL